MSVSILVPLAFWTVLGREGVEKRFDPRELWGRALRGQRRGRSLTGQHQGDGKVSETAAPASSPAKAQVSPRGEEGESGILPPPWADLLL